MTGVQTCALPICFPVTIGGADRAEALGEAEGEHGIGLETEKGGVGMIVDGAAGPVGQVGGIPDVIPVTVGKEEGVGLEFFLFEEVEEALGASTTRRRICQ